MERTRGTAGRVIVLSVLAASVLAACTKAGGATTGPTTGASGASVRGLSAGKIILAGDATLSIPGANSPFPGIQQGIQARIARANRQGGIAGRTIEYAGTMDDQGSQSTLLSNIQQAVLSKNVFGIGPVITVANLPTAFIAQDSVPTFGFGDSPGWCNEPYAMSFDGCLESTNIGDDTTAALVAQYLHGGKGKTYGLIFSDSQAAGLKVDAAAASAAGFSVCYRQAIVPLTPVSDYTPYVVPEMRSCGHGKGPDVMFVAPTGLQAELGIINGLHAAGFKGLIVTATYDPNLLKAPGVAPALAGSVIIVYSVAPEQFSSAGLAQFEHDLTAISAPTTGGFSYGELLGYAATDFMIRSLEHVGKNLTAAALADQMKAGYTYPGMSSFIPPTRYPAGYKEATPCGSLLKVTGGTFAPAVPLTCYRDIPLP